MVTILDVILFFFIILLIIPSVYLIILAVASIRPIINVVTEHQPGYLRFLISIPAHNEESVIGLTVKQLLELDYPKELFRVCIVADHCTDNTAKFAQQAGAIVYERQEGPRTGKGAALSWLFQKTLSQDDWDVVTVFDADTQVDRNFLQVMNAQMLKGDQVIQGQHIINNPDQGWFPALTWAMFLIDNRFQNHGRHNLGWSVKHMGDSICFRSDVLRQVGWGTGLTEDYNLRQQLLLKGVKIRYQPAARGYGEAPLSWLQARPQRARWLKGTRDTSRQLAREMFWKGIQRHDWALLDGAIQAYLPSFSTLVMLSMTLLLFYVGSILLFYIAYTPLLFWSLLALIVLLFVYPLFGLWLERAPVKAYLVIVTGPIFIMWRTLLAINSRLGNKQIIWVRTSHGQTK
jgi:cellulose synthase/poly-beta-1,6-N-acetylglucosamine synthase-like glycosyltransferase